MRLELLALCVPLLVLGGCAAQLHSGSTCVVDPGYLENETEFTWREVSVDVVDTTGYVSPIMLEDLRKTVIAELSGKGLTFVERRESETDQWSDVEIGLTLRVRRELQSYGIDPSPCESVDCWERIDGGSSTRMELRTVGFLAADVYHLGEPIWRGWVERSLYPSDRDEADVVIAEAVPALFATFPP